MSHGMWFDEFAPRTIKFADTAMRDSFKRLRVSNPTSVFEYQAQFGDNALFWDTSVSGTGAVSNLLAEAAVQLSTGGTASGAKAIRQTHVYHRYQPGKGFQVLMTFCFVSAPTSNLRRRVGFFDENNGIFLEQTSAGLFWVQRSNTSGSVVDTRVAQADWNVDKLDGTGPSGIVLDTTKTNILDLDLQWLGVGRVRCGFDINSEVFYAHYFNNANAVTSAYMYQANLPVRQEIENTGVTAGTNTLKQICCSVTNAGGVETNKGTQFAGSTGSTGVSITTRAPVISLRAKTTFNGVKFHGHIEPLDLQTLNVGNKDLFCEVVLNGTLTGASFADVNTTYSAAQIDVSATAISGGIVLDSFYIPGPATGSVTNFRDFVERRPLTTNIGGAVGDIMSFVCTSIPGTAATVYGSFNWREQK